MKKILNLIIVLILFTVGLSAENKYNFKATNGPYGGYIRSFCYDSTNHDVYANSDKIYKLNKTTNKWEKQFDSIYNDQYRSYEMIYADSIYFISFIKGSSDQVWGAGQLRSTDKGKTWQEIKDFENNIRSIVKLGSVFFAVTGFYDGGVYKSTDFGISWSLSNNGIDSSTIHNGSFSQLEILKSKEKNYIFSHIYSI